MFGLRHRGSSTTGLDDLQVSFEHLGIFMKVPLNFPCIWNQNFFSGNCPSEGGHTGGGGVYGGGEGQVRDLRVLHENSW